MANLKDLLVSGAAKLLSTLRVSGDTHIDGTLYLNGPIGSANRMVYVDNTGKFVPGKDLSAVTNFDSSNAIEKIVRTANATTYTLTTVAGATSTLATPVAAGTKDYMAIYTDAYNVGATAVARIYDGCLNLYPTSSSYRQGIRIHPTSNWSGIVLMGNTNTNTSGIATTDWWFGNTAGTLYLTHAGDISSNTGYLKASTENSAGYWQFYQRVGINGISNAYNLYINGTTMQNGIFYGRHSSNYINGILNSSNVGIGWNISPRIGVNIDANTNYTAYINGATRIDGGSLTVYNSSTTANNYGSTINLTTKDTTANTEETAVIQSYNSHVGYGAHLSISTGSSILMYAGDGALPTIKGLFIKTSASSDENLWLGADNSVYIYSKGDSAANRVGVKIDSGNLLPQKAEVANTNAQNLGASGNRWAKLYIGTADTYGSAYIPVWWNNGVPQAVTDNKMIVNLGAHTAGESDTYASSVWREKPRPGVYGILPTAGGGTGNSSWTANRLVYSNTATKLASTAIVSDGNYLSKVTYFTINGDHQTTYRLWTDGAARIARNLILLNSTPKQGDLVLSALGYKTGYPFETDPTFLTSSGNMKLYNNSNSTAPYVTVERLTYTNAGLAEAPGTNSTYVIRIQNTGSGTSPGMGGFMQVYNSRANAVYIQIFRALIPVGYQVNTASNTMGDSYKDDWLTDQQGTGKWEWYARRVLCGASGSMGNGGHVYLTSTNTNTYPIGTTDAPVTWYVSYCNCYDVTRAEYDGLVTRFADAAHITTNTSGVAYYINTTGTFGNIRTANGAFYSTGQDVTPQFGILPTAQGGSGNNSFTAQRLVYNPTATQMASAGKLESNGNYLHILNTDDISGTAASTNAPFAVGDLSNQHIVMDNNEIISKSSSTGSGTLNLQTDGGYIYAGASIGIRGTDANFSLYVNGASRFNGNVLINMTEHTQFKLIAGADNTQTAYTPVLNVNGKMRLTDTLAIPANHRAIEFRPDHTSYNSYIYYATSGNESLNFVHRQSVTSFIFWTGNRVESASNWYLQDDGTTARTDNPAVQIKQNSLYVNKLIPSGTNTLAQFYVNGFSIIGKETLDNTAFTNTLMITANQSSESGGEAFTETKPSWGITFRRQWNNGTMNTTSAGIYAVGVASWRAGLAFRTKTNTTNTGSHDTTAMWLSPEGRVGIGTTNPEQKVHINGGYLYIYNNAKGIKIGAENGSWIHFVAGADFWFNRTGSIQGHWRPYGDNTYDLGATDNRWRNLYLSGGIRTQSQQALYVGSQQRSRWYKITLPEHGQSNINPSDAARWYMHSMTIVVGGDYNNNPRGQIELKYYIYWNKTAYSFDKCYATACGPDINKVKIYAKITEPFIIYIDTSNAYSSIWVEHLHGLDSAAGYSTLNTKVETQADITIDANYSPMPMVYLGTTSDIPTVWKTWNDFDPATNNTYYLGSTSLAWKQIFSNGIAVNNAGANNDGGISLWSNMGQITSYGIAMRASAAHGWVTAAQSNADIARAQGIATSDASGLDWGIRFYNAGSKLRGFQWLHGGTVMASLNGYGYMQVNRLGLNRTGGNANGRIYWYSPAYYTWVTYMSNPGDGIAPHGGRPSVLGSVTNWAMRSLIENAGGYGWVWESATNAVAAAATTPTPLMALNSNDGTLFLNGDMIISSTSGEQDRSLIFGYKNDTTQTQDNGASWRIVHKASGSGNTNYFAIETTGSAAGNSKAWVNTLRIGMDAHEGTFNGNWLPQTTAVFDLGAPSQRWNNLYLQGNLVMQDVGTPSAYAYVSNKITWTGGADGAELYYQIDSADAGRLMINTKDDANCLVAMAYNGTAKAYFANATPSFYPATSGTGSLGLSDNRWNELYVNNVVINGSNSYGAYGYPVYWSGGKPVATYPCQYTTWTIASGGTSVTLTKTNYYFADTYVIALIVTSGESYLNGPITWTSAANMLTLTTSAATSGAVSGYVITARAHAI